MAQGVAFTAHPRVHFVRTRINCGHPCRPPEFLRAKDILWRGVCPVRQLPGDGFVNWKRIIWHCFFSLLLDTAHSQKVC